MTLEEKVRTKSQVHCSAGIKKVGTEDEKLEFYGLYKQVTVGDINTSQTLGMGGGRL